MHHLYSTLFVLFSGSVLLAECSLVSILRREQGIEGVKCMLLVDKNNRSDSGFEELRQQYCCPEGTIKDEPVFPVLEQNSSFYSTCA